MLSYFSGETQENLNGCAIRSNGEIIACRHLAHAFAKGTIGHNKPKFDEIDTIEKLSNSSAVVTDAELIQSFNFSNCPSDAIYFDTASLAKAIQAAAATLKPGESKSYLLRSNNHGMAVEIKKSTKNTKGITLNFYDPNDTLRYKKIVAKDISNLKDLSFDDLLSEEKQRRYFPDGSETGVLLSLNTSEKRDDCKVQCFAQPRQSLCSLLLCYGHYGHPNLPFDLPVSSKDQPKSAQGLNSFTGAVLLEHREAAEAYLDIVCASDLNDTDKKELLGKSKDNSSLGYLYEKGATRTIKTYIQLISESKLSDDVKKELLAGEHPGCTAPLMKAIFTEDVEAAEAYINGILNSKLNDDIKKALFSSLNSAMVQSSKLGDKVKQKLLTFVPVYESDDTSGYESSDDEWC